MKLIHKLLNAPLDVKIFLFNPLLLLGLFFLPDEPNHLIVVTTYIVFMFVSIAISGFFITYVRDSEYNVFRKAETIRQVLITVGVYILVVISISYVLAVTEWFLFLFN